MTALVRAEFKKVVSTRLWWALLIGALAFSALQSLVTALFSGVDAGAGQPSMPGLETAEAIRSVYPMAMFSGTYMFALVLGITGMTGEYRYQTITSTFLVSPRRHRVVVAKILAHVVMGALYAVLGLLTVLDRPSAVPDPGGVQFDPGDASAPFGFVGDNQAKGVSPVPAVTFHATQAWSREHWDDDAETLRGELLARAGKLPVGLRERAQKDVGPERRGDSPH